MPLSDTLASVDDLAAFTGQGAEINHERAELVLGMATATIQAEAGQHLLHVTGDVAVLVGNAATVTLPQRPVTAVTTVTSTYGGVTTTHTGWTLHNDTLTVSSTWPTYWPALLTVTYSHGYTVIPSDLQSVCLSLAARLFSGPTDGVIGETQGQWSTQWDRSLTGGALTEGERRVVRRYRRTAYSLSVA